MNPNVTSSTTHMRNGEGSKSDDNEEARLKKEIASTIKCIELLFGVDVGLAKSNMQTLGGVNFRKKDLNYQLKANLATLNINLPEGTSKPNWDTGGLTKVFARLGYVTETKNSGRILVDHLFHSNDVNDESSDNVNTIKENAKASSRIQDNHAPVFTRSSRSRKFSPPRPLTSKIKISQEEDLPSDAVKEKEAKTSALGDFCKRISTPGQSFTSFKQNRNLKQPEEVSVTSNTQEPRTAFVSAYQQMILDDKAKGIKRPRLPPPGSSNVHISGIRKIPRVESSNGNSNYSNPQKISKNESEEGGSDNPEVQELMLDERIKNVEPKMVEAILNEIIEVDSNTTWDDIAGLQGPKNIIKEIIIWPLQRPDIFTGLRGPPRGLLLYGPPGTGKTLIGRLIATQSKSTFFNISASSLTSKWIGDGEKMVRALFQIATVKAPSVIFIDEIDSILTQRSDTEHESSRRLKTEFLIQFDGCATKSQERILVIGVTNRPQELDEAARRRFVKRIYIPLPDCEGRTRLIQNALKGQNFSMEESDFQSVAELTEGYSGADMASLVREAAYGPIRDIGHDIENINVSEVRPIQRKDFQQALKYVKASVAPKDLILYEEWDKQFGCQLAS